MSLTPGMLLLELLAFTTNGTAAPPTPEPILQATAISHSKRVGPGSEFAVSLVLENRTASHLSDLAVEHKPQPLFRLVEPFSGISDLPPFTQQLATGRFSASEIGEAILLIAVRGERIDEMGQPRQVLLIARTEPITVAAPAGETLEKALFLALGTLLTLVSAIVSSILTVRLKSRVDVRLKLEEERRSHREGELLVASQMIAFLRATYMLIEANKPTLEDWSKLVSKEGTYFALHRLSQNSEGLDLPSLVSDLYVEIGDYDARLRRNPALTEPKRADLLQRIKHLIDSLQLVIVSI